MAAEKACKAHLVAASGHENLRKTHACVARTLPIIARGLYRAINNQSRIPRSEISEIERLALEIEVLAPACDGGNLRQDNSECPWQDGKGEIHVPCEYSFASIDDGSREIVRLIWLIRSACESYPRLR